MGVGVITDFIVFKFEKYQNLYLIFMYKET